MEKLERTIRGSVILLVGLIFGAISYTAGGVPVLAVLAWICIGIGLYFLASKAPSVGDKSKVK